MTYSAADNRYESMTYRRCGRSGISLPAISLGLWHNFGDDRSRDSQQAILR
ncbi:MAG: aldo/keto reductase, partial [Jatrophihabitantaceae bacterium]